MRRGKKTPTAGTRRKVRTLQSYDGVFRCKASFASIGLREYVIVMARNRGMGRA